MPFRHLDPVELSYYLISVDKNGIERRDDPDAPGGLLSDAVVTRLEEDPITDLFVLSHGWMGDVPAAVRQCDDWIGAMASASVDLERIKRERPAFLPLIVGFHWPSLPFGDESFDGVTFSTPDAAVIVADVVEPLIEQYAGGIADSPAARAALRVILVAAAEAVMPPALAPAVIAAYQVLNRESGMGHVGPAARPGDDRDPFDPEAVYQAARREGEVSFASPAFGPVLAPLQTLSYFKMKDRARQMGEVGVHGLVARFQHAAADVGRDLRVHLMGHSFGCIVQSAATAGPPGRYALRKPIDSLTLMQGALSLWSYCSDVPHAKGHAGYFRPLVADKRVAGAIVTTQSEYDTAVGKMYPLASSVRGDVVFDATEFPKYGALGTFGVRGPGCDALDLDMLDTASSYRLQPGRIYNVNATRYITQMKGSSGAHNDIASKEVAHAMWAAVRA